MGHGAHCCGGQHGYSVFTRRRFLQGSLLAAGGLLALGRNGAWAQGAPTEIRIGATISQSGPFQAIVSPFPKLMQAWVNHVNARGGIFLKAYNKALPIRLILNDDKSEPATALNLYERMATVDKVDLFYGPFSSFLTNAALQAAITHKIPFFMAEANDSVLYEKENPWRTGGDGLALNEFDRLVQFYVAKQGVKTFAILGRDNLHEQSAVKGLGESLPKHGFQVVYQDMAPRDIKDFSSIMLGIKAKNPDVLIVESIAPPWTIQAFKQAREQGVNPVDIVAGHGPVPVVKGLGESAQNLVTLVHQFQGDSPDHKEFAALCREAGFEPETFSEAGVRYRAFKRIEDALTRAGSLDKEAVRQAMWSTNLAIFGTETMKHDPRGWGTNVPYPWQVQQGKYVSLWPVEKGTKLHQFKNRQW